MTGVTNGSGSGGGLRRRAMVTWLSEHPQLPRLFASGLALCWAVAILLLIAAWLNATYPPTVPSGATVVPTAVLTTGELPLTALCLLAALLVVCGGIRTLLTDRFLLYLRERVGADTLVAKRWGVEDDLTGATAANETSRLQLRGEYLDERGPILMTSARTALDRLHKGPPLRPRHRWRWGIDLSRKRRSPPMTPSSAEQAEGWRQGVLNSALRAIVAPDTVFSRVAETHVLGDERASATVARSIEGSAELDDLVLVPVLRVPRGSLLGTLRVTIHDTPTSTLPTSLARGVLLLLFHQLTLTVAQRLDDEHKEMLRTSAELAARAIVSDLPSSAVDREKIRAGFNTAQLDKIQPLGPWLRALTEQAIAADIVFAVAPQGFTDSSRIVVTYDEPYREPVRGPVAFARRTLGIGLTDVQIDLHRAAEARSYHLDVTAPGSMHVEQASVRIPGILPKPDHKVAAARSELIHIAPSRGDGHAHVYWRDFDRSIDHLDTGGTSTPSFRIRIRERPPGLLGPTLALSFWLFTIAWLIAYFYPALFSDGGAGSSAWATLVLAAPALLAGWLLSRLNADAMRFTSVSTFALILWLSLNVALVATVAALTFSGVHLTTLTLPQPPLITIGHYGWFLLMVLTALNLGACSLLFIGRSRRYARTINERVSE